MRASVTARCGKITPGNVKNLEQKWIFQAESLEKFETTPLVVDGIMYITQAPSDTRRPRCEDGTGVLDLSLLHVSDVKPVLRLGESRSRDPGRYAVFATLDAHLVALDAKTGRPLWNIESRRIQTRAMR